MEKIHLEGVKFFGKVWKKFLVIDSTNNYLKSVSNLNETESGTVITALYQTMGRGQMDNSWESNASENIILSALLKYTNIQTEDLFLINQFFANTVHLFLNKYVDKSEKLWIKWPNDILVNHQKISGILIENIFSGSTLKSLIFGVGINLNQELLPDSAVSLTKISKLKYDINILTEEFIRILDQEFDLIKTFDKSSTQKIKDYYFDNLLNYNKKASYQTENGKIFEAVLTDVDSQGRLILVEGNNTYRLSIKQVKFLYQENPN